MQNFRRTSILSVTIAIVLFTFSTSLFAQDTKKLTPKPQTTFQTVEGWGSSLCWWAHMVGQWEDEEKMDELIDLITSADKLNMNIFRYNIGGGDHPSHYTTAEQKGHMANGKGVRAEMQGFLSEEGGAYNWDADAGQRKIMLKIKEKRPDAVFEAFSNSAPWWMTYSGCSAGNHNASDDNLKPEYYNAFCDYLITVAQHYKDEYGLEFKTLEPFNEPQTSYWNYKGSQEGCHFDIESQIKVLEVLYPKLKATGMKTVISASDETSVKEFNRAMKAYLESGAIKYVGQINTHTYSVNNELREEAYDLSKQIGVDFWQSETGPQGIPGNNFENNLGLALRLVRDMNIMQPQAWLDWQLMEEWNQTWCLFQGSFENESFQLIKNFYVRMQVTRFVKQGYTLIDSGDKEVLMALNPEKTKLVVVLVNPTDKDKQYSFDWSGFKSISNTPKIYRTSNSENCELISAKDYNAKKKSYAVEASTISTLLFDVK